MLWTIVVILVVLWLLGALGTVSLPVLVGEHGARPARHRGHHRGHSASVGAAQAVATFAILRGGRSKIGVSCLRPSAISNWSCVGLAFFLSGAAALAYQVAWQRILALQTGVGLYSIAVIVAAFMLGLGLGSHLGGVASTRVTARRALDPVRGLRAGHRRLRRAEPPPLLRLALRPARLALRGAAARGPAPVRDPGRPHHPHGDVAALPDPRHGAATRRRRAGRSAFLYGINVLGAAAGALATPWVFIRHHGIGAAVWRRVAANLVARARARWPWPCGNGEAPAGGRAAAPGGRRPPRRGGSAAALRELARALRPQRLLRARPRDLVVPRHGRRGQVDRVHVRHRARPATCSGPAWAPRGHRARAPRSAAPARVPRLPVPPAPLRLRGASRCLVCACRPRAAGYPGTTSSGAARARSTSAAPMYWARC